MSLFEAVYGRSPSFGLASLSVTKEHWDVINDEDELLNFLQTLVVDSILESCDGSSHIFQNEVPTNEYNFEPLSSYLYKLPLFPTIMKPRYHTQIRHGQLLTV